MPNGCLKLLSIYIPFIQIKLTTRASVYFVFVECIFVNSLLCTCYISCHVFCLQEVFRYRYTGLCQVPLSVGFAQPVQGLQDMRQGLYLRGMYSVVRSSLG